MSATVRATIKMFGGTVKQITHESVSTRTPMNFSVFLPPQVSSGPVPALYWLSGLTCTDENFLTKAGAQKRAADLGVALIMPDTSPRGAGIEGEDDAYDFGTGAGFYVDAVRPKWRDHYNMYSYVTKELPQVVAREFSEICVERKSIFGHSMGGHGALICALKNPGIYRSVSAFSPISNPVNCPWGRKAFEGYFGSDNAHLWDIYDATELARAYEGPPMDVLIDQGGDDTFYIDGQLLPENLEEACKGKDNLNANVRIREGYDHSYFFIASFVDEHLEHHARALFENDS